MSSSVGVTQGRLGLGASGTISVIPHLVQRTRLPRTFSGTQRSALHVSRGHMSVTGMVCFETLSVRLHHRPVDAKHTSSTIDNIQHPF